MLYAKHIFTLVLHHTKYIYTTSRCIFYNLLLCRFSFIFTKDQFLSIRCAPVVFKPHHTHAVPPSPPLNVRVVAISSTTLTLTWEEPVSTGGRSRTELRYNLWFRAAGETSITLSNTVTTTMGVIGGNLSFGFSIAWSMISTTFIRKCQPLICTHPPPPLTHTHTAHTRTQDYPQILYTQCL